MPYKDKSCGVCSATFTPANGRQLYCPGECSHNAKLAAVSAWGYANRRVRYSEPREAATTCVCGAAITNPDMRRRYCSESCYRARRNEWQRKYEEMVRMKGRTTEPLSPITCELDTCGEVFLPSQAHQRFCSLKCRRKLTRRMGYRLDNGLKPIETKTPGNERKAETMRDALRHLGMVSAPGFLSAGYTENAPREATTPGPTGCPHCRAYGRDTLGRVQHSNWCREAS